jgi:hypothetical protein
MIRNLIIMIGLTVLISPLAARAQGVITDGDARWEYNNAPGTPGSADFEPDSGGVSDDDLVQNWWWFRITSGPGAGLVETPLAWPPSSQSYVGNVATLSDSQSGLDWEIVTTLLDDPQVGNALVSEALTLTNTTAATLELRVFNYANFDVGADALDDTSVLLGPADLGFIDDLALDTAGLEGVGATGFQVGDPATLLGFLNDLTIFTPDNDPTPMGPGDLAGVVEYDISISPGGMVTLDELLRVSFVPEPATAALLLLSGAVGLRRRRLS